MKIEIWNEDQNEEEQPLRLRLVSVRDEAELQVVSATGVRLGRGSLLRILSNGQLRLEPSISHKFGLKLDSRSRLEVS